VRRRYLRPLAGVLASLMLLPLAGCQPSVQGQSPGGQTQLPTGPPGPTARVPTRTPGPPGPTRKGMSTGQKVLLVAGAAALYYMYQKHKNRQGQGPDGRYFLSKNGRVYYRDMKTGAFHWVDPPQQPIRVPAEEYERYTGQRVGAYNDGQVLREAPSGWQQDALAASGSGGR
jgi:hypothetical protein